MQGRLWASSLLLFLAGTLLGCGTEETPISSGSLTIDGVELPYIVEGQGLPTLVTCDAELARRAFSAELRDHLQLILTDPRIFIEGVAPSTLATMTMASISMDFERIRQHLGLEKIAVMGHSICGLFAIEYAKAYPERVSHVVMIGTPPGWASEFRTVTTTYWAENASADRKATLARNRELLPQDSLSRLPPQDASWASYARSTPMYFFDFDFDPTPLIQGVYYPIEGLDHLMGSVIPEYEFPNPDEIAAPILLALGMHDYVVPPPLWDETRDRFPNLTTLVFERSGHFPHFEEEAYFDEQLLGWIEGG